MTLRHSRKSCILYQVNLPESTLVVSNPCCNACFTILLLNISMDMPSSQNRSNCAFRCSFLRLATIPTAKSGFKMRNYLWKFYFDMYNEKSIIDGLRLLFYLVKGHLGICMIVSFSSSVSGELFLSIILSLPSPMLSHVFRVPITYSAIMEFP